MNSTWTFMCLHLWCSGLRAEVSLHCTCQTLNCAQAFESLQMELKYLYVFIVCWFTAVAFRVKDPVLYLFSNTPQNITNATFVTMLGLSLGKQDAYKLHFESGVMSAIAMKEDISLLRVDFKIKVPQKLILNSFLPLSSLSCLVDLLSCLQVQLFSCGMNVVSFRKSAQCWRVRQLIFLIARLFGFLTDT